MMSPRRHFKRPWFVKDAMEMSFGSFRVKQLIVIVNTFKQFIEATS